MRSGNSVPSRRRPGISWAALPAILSRNSAGDSAIEGSSRERMPEPMVCSSDMPNIVAPALLNMQMLPSFVQDTMAFTSICMMLWS